MDDTPHRSVHSDGWDEANRHMWIQSERAGRDLGEEAIRQWVREHWRGFLRSRWLEHLEGKCYWIEMNPADFGLLKTAFADDSDRALLAKVVHRLKAGEDNLTIILWAVEEQLPVDAVMNILTALDVNSSRILSHLGRRAEETSPSAALLRAERILAEGHRRDDLLPIPQELRDAAERELGTKPISPAEFWKSLLDATLRHHHAGQRAVTKRLPKGVVVLAVGRAEVAEFLAHFPADKRAGTAVEDV